MSRLRFHVTLLEYSDRDIFRTLFITLIEKLKGTRRIVNLLTFMLLGLKAERCDFDRKIAPALEPFQNKDSILVLLL